MAIHVSQCMAKACMCDTWQAMCVTHGMPCVNMHGTFGHYLRAFIHGVSRISPWEQQGEGGGREKRKGGKEKRKGGKERRNVGKEKKEEIRKEKKKEEEERKKKEEREGVSRSEETQTAKNLELRYER